MDYIPAEDHLALVWMETFVSTISSSPYTYLLAPADAVAMTAAVQGFADALAISDNVNTRTKPTIIAKDDARTSAEQMCRKYAQMIKANPGISDSDKVAAGVRPQNSSREPIEVPATSPILNIIAATPGAQTLRFADSMTPDSPAKPFGAIQLQLFMAVTPEEVGDVSQADYVASYTKNPIAVEFTEAQDGAIATYWARWISRRGDVGPWSLPISMRIAA